MHSARRTAISILLCLGATQALADVATTPPLASVESLDVQRYMGKWYEISHYPNWFQKKCQGASRAEYALKDNGVKASMHIYPTGGHGWGIRKNFKYREQWQQTVLDWLQGIAK